MTTDRRAALVEAMATEIYDRGEFIQMSDCKLIASALADLALEEAARVAEGKSVEAAGNVYQTDKPGNFWDEDSVYGTGRRQAADAIRALKSKP